MIAILLSAALVAAPAAGESVGGNASATQPSASAVTAEQVQFFETRIRPLLVENCQKCHGVKKQQAGLRLDSRPRILDGGDSGPAIVPGKPDESLLISAVRQVDKDLKMPPNDKLSDRQVADLSRWIAEGAVFPETQPTGVRSRDPNHWSFKPPADPPVPQVKNAAWPKSPLDSFILAQLEATGVNPAPLADKPTLIRRVTFDLTGLPPTPAEIEDFLADDHPDAFGRLVERLLASPAYGERWGRHWLDIARYADSNGLDENVAHGNAWRYRDYVIAAINRDKPLDRFIVEQLAGDLLPYDSPEQRHEQLIATGFLAIGSKVLAEVDEAKMQMDIVDEQIDTVGRALLGLTLGCARCHDHKFDPIDTVDYYGLAGVFKSTRTMENYKKIARWYENLLPSPEATAMRAEYDAQLATKKQAVADFISHANEQVRVKSTDKPPAKLETLYSDEAKAALKKLRDELAALEKNPPELPSAMGVTEDSIADVPVHIRGSTQKLGNVVSRHTPLVLHGPTIPEFDADESGRRQLAQWLVDPQHPLTSRVLVNRIWRWHFGKGLVATPDNFGLLGEPPSHPELLDWLARRLIADGWSLKSLHRLILNSATYQQSSTPAVETLARDPENRLLGRMSLRRLEAEELRDSLLAVGGQLDRTPGGSLLNVKNRAFVFDHTSKDMTDYSSRRRSVYLPVIRNNVLDLYQLLDFPDAAVSSGDRATTTVAPQALMMLNSNFVLKSAADFAGRLLNEASDDDARISRMYALAYGRPPTAAQRQSDLALLDRIDRALTASEPDADQRRRQAWTAVCQAIIAANEFIYIK